MEINIPLKKVDHNIEIKDHHLFFKLITQAIDRYLSEKLDENDSQILMILSTLLDFR